MNTPKFQVGQTVRVRFSERNGPTPFPLGVRQTVRRGDRTFEVMGGTVHGIRRRGNEVWYQVGGQVGDDPDELWSADFREIELQAI